MPAKPSFLLSTERSGSNLTRSILNTHSEISAPHPLDTTYPWESTNPPEELGEQKTRKLVRDIIIGKGYSFQPMDTVLDVRDVFEKAWASDERSFLAIQKALYEEAAENEDCSIWMSKHPGIWGCLEDILEYYDDPKFVYLVRDARDMALSCKTSNIDINHPYFAARRWSEEQKKGLEMLDRYPEKVHNLKYEDLLQDPEEEVRKVCRFLDIEFEEKMLYYYETEEAREASKKSDAFENLSTPIKSDNYEKYKDQMPDGEVAIVEKVCRDELTQFGYDLTNDESYLDRFELEEEEYEEIGDRVRREKTLKYWRESPKEQASRFMSSSFGRYLILRYGILG